MKPVPPEGFLRTPLHWCRVTRVAASVNQMSRRAIENFTGNEFRSPRSRPAPSPHPAQLNIHNIQIYTYFSFLCILVVCVAFTMEPENLIFPDVTRLGPLSAHTAPQSLCLRTPHSSLRTLVSGHRRLRPVWVHRHKFLPFSKCQLSHKQVVTLQTPRKYRLSPLGETIGDAHVNIDSRLEPHISRVGDQAHGLTEHVLGVGAGHPPRPPGDLGGCP